MDKHCYCRVDICGVGPVLCGWQPGGASLQVFRRLRRVAAKRLSVFARLIWERLGASERSLPRPSLCDEAEPKDDAVTHRSPANVTASEWKVTV